MALAEEQFSAAAVEELRKLLDTERDGPSNVTAETMRTELQRPFHPSVKKSKQGFTYIPHAIIRYRVIKATGNNFTWEIDPPVFRSGDEIAQSGKLVCIVVGRLTIPGLGTRVGIGTAVIQKGTEDQYKSAESDAFKRAAMGFGVALELYSDDIEARIEERASGHQASPPPSAPQPRPANRQEATQTQPASTPPGGADPSWGDLTKPPEQWTGRAAFWKKAIDDYHAGLSKSTPEQVEEQFKRADPPQAIVDYFTARALEASERRRQAKAAA